MMNLPAYLTEDSDGFIHVTGHRVGLEHLVYYYNEGFSSEMLACEYPSLSLAQIHRVIAFYLENQAEVDQYIEECQQQVDKQRHSTTTGSVLEQLRQRVQRTASRSQGV